jgi:RNA polymerase sigma-70 factor (ECF subfamily)
MILADSPAKGSQRLPTELPQHTDQELIAAANRGDYSAFEELYRRHRDWVVRLAFRFTHDEDLALDVLQEVFVYFLKKFPGFELRCDLKTFLYPAVRNVAISMRRKEERFVSGGEGLEEVPGEAASQEGEAGDALLAVVRALPEQQREVLLLRFVDGLALGEIATALEIPLGTVKSRLHNGLAALEKDPRTRSFFGE